jgi:UDP-N-acetyl-alpha-D-muramoyl-L-alanyl-L-glutamate epimerase
VGEERVERLRARYPTFVYEGYEHHAGANGTLRCSFRFRAGDLAFEPSCRFTFAREPSRISREILDNLVFHLGLAEMPSYWKATCSPRVLVRAGALGPSQTAFWTRVLTEGMGEFHFKNRTPFTDPGFVTIEAEGGRGHAVSADRLERGHVVPVGGGKDSLVTLDLLGQRTEEITAIAINPPPSTDEAIRIAGVTDPVVVARQIDPRLLQLNEAGFLNGHTPFGVVIGFASALAAVLLGRKYIALSNESSSDHATLLYRGKVINHQYGKSSAFEAAMHAYLAEHVAQDLHYFSLLRPFNELRIAQRFSELSRFHPVVRSCNRGRKTDAWCGRCPKCLSTFIVLAPFMERVDLVEIFGEDLLASPEARALLPSLLSDDGAERPFECVATPAELRAALTLCGEAGERLDRASMEVLTQRSERHLAPEDLDRLVDAALRPRVLPLLSHTAVGVVGLGIEGTATCRHLLSRVERLDLTVIDDDAAAALRLPAAERPSQAIRFVSGPDAEGVDLDVVFKSPGVPPDHPAIARLRERPSISTSNTELFFERRKGTIIGVTGTKGKSTTTSLLAHVLRAAGKDARLMGNIGKPCLDDPLDPKATSETIHCVELSSFQLEDLRVSPDIAVVLGIFGDHLDRYGDMGSYLAAKSSITRYQGRSDVVLYNADCPRATALAGLGAARRVPFGKERPDLLGDTRGPLLGDFNHYNIWPSVLVGRMLGIGDDQISEAIRGFRPLRGRLETVADKEGVRFVCDIRSTAPEVTVAALEALDQDGERVDFLLLGGVDRHQDYRTLVPALSRSSVRHVILFPPTGARIRGVLEATELADRLSFFEPESMEEAIRYVYGRASDRSVCLMSTGAPSHGGLFRGPDDKARQFARWASELGRASP